VLLTVVVLAPLVLLLAGFVGCQAFFPLDDPPPEEETGTTAGGQPTIIDIALEVSPMCDASADAIAIVLSTDITTKQFSVTLTTIPPEGQTISTDQLGIVLEAEGNVFCAVTTTPAEGDPPPLLEATHDKAKNELVQPFKLVCEDGFELT
jgi:hypothetical protein